MVGPARGTSLSTHTHTYNHLIRQCFIDLGWVHVTCKWRDLTLQPCLGHLPARDNPGLLFQNAALVVRSEFERSGSRGAFLSAKVYAPNF